MVRQLSLFGDDDETLEPPPTRRGRTTAIGPVEVEASVRDRALRLPANLYFGTSSWSFPGWAGLVYDRPASESTLARRGLTAYAQHPLLRTVSVDRSYYAPVPADKFREYADAVPESFRFCVKAVERSTVPRFPDHPRYGARAGLDNPQFLDPAFCAEQVVGPTLEGLGSKLGALVFQFSPMDLAALGGAPRFVERLHQFLCALPRGPTYAVELRNLQILGEAYRRALTDAGAVHCLNLHPSMPALPVQCERMTTLPPGPLVVRWMLGRGMRYQQALERYEPFDRLVDEDPVARSEVAEICAMASKTRPAVFVLINNKAEGSSPLSVFRLVEELLARGLLDADDRPPT